MVAMTTPPPNDAPGVNWYWMFPADKVETAIARWYIHLVNGKEGNTNQTKSMSSDRKVTDSQVVRAGVSLICNVLS